MNRVVCEHCNESFSKKGNLKTHQGLNKRNGKFKVSCSGLDPSLKKKMISEYPHLVKEYNGNEDLTKITYASSKFLDWKCSTCEHEWSAEAKSRARANTGCVVCKNGYLHSDGRNSMANTHPELAKEYQGDASKIVAGTGKKLDWKCSTCEHEWTTTGSHRVNGNGCGYCNSGDLHSDGRNSMANTHPELAKEYLGDATKIIAGTHKILDWKCSTCEHEWSTRAKNRAAREDGCPACAGQVVHSDGRNSMAKTHPELAKEYLGDATKIIAGTNKKLDWKCSTCEHEWKATGNSRTVMESGCPACADHGFDKSKPASVYQIRFHTRNHGIFYKCGITNNEIHPRTIKIINNYKETYGDVIDVRINDEIYFEQGSDAWDFERKLKTSGLDLGSEFFSQKFDGYTETYAPSVIPFWNTLKAEYTDVSNL